MNYSQEKHKSFDIVWYLSGDWDTDHRRQMITSFAKNLDSNGKILCVNRPICLLTGSFLKPKKFIQWVGGGLPLIKITKNLYVCTPFVFIHDQIARKLGRGLTFINRAALSFFLNKSIKKCGFDSEMRLAWVYNPWQIDYVGLVGEDGYIYECYDDYRECRKSLFSKDEILRYEQKLASEALLVFNTARKLYERNIKNNPNNYYIPNGVNLELFAESERKNKGKPSDLTNVKPPIIGFVGNIDPHLKVDCQLIQELAVRNPSYSFVFLGKIVKSKETDSLFKMRNIHHLGFKIYEELRQYMSAFDIGIIPFKINKFSESLNPLKLYEFMAMGCPVISTDIPELRRFSEFISICKDLDTFDGQLKKLISEDLTDLKNRLLNEAKNHSWDSRTGVMIKLIEERFINNEPRV